MALVRAFACKYSSKVGEAVMKRIKRFTALFLALILFCMSFPVSAFAANTPLTYYIWNARLTEGRNSLPNSKYGDQSYYNSYPYSISEYTALIFYTGSWKYNPAGDSDVSIDSFYNIKTFKVNDGDTVTIKYNVNTTLTKARVTYSFLDNAYYDMASLVNQEGSTTVDGSEDYTFKFTADKDFTFQTLKFNITNFTSNDGYLRCGISNVTISISDGQGTTNTKNMNKFTSWFDNLWQWLKDILDNIKAIPTKLTTEFTAIKNSLSTWFGNVTSSISTNFTNISNSLKTWFESVGEWFTNLSSSIGTFFSNLSDSLKEWFKNVGNWFSELGTNIGNFFTNLWENITGAITERVNAFHEWWDSLWSLPDGWSEEYKEKWNTWLSAHFGILVNSVEFIEYTFSLFTDWSQSDDLRIIIPKITIPVVDKVLLKRTSFDFNTFFDNEHFVYAFYLYDTVVSCICAYFVFTFARKTFFNMIDKNKRLED